jgi:transglutaminase-like putative cysteine protease
MKFDIVHRTQYSYATPVRDSFNEVRLQPFSDERQTVESFILKVLPSTQLRHYRDFYSNYVHHFEVNEPHTSLLVESQLKVSTQPQHGPALEARPALMSELKNVMHVDRCYDFVQASTYVDTTPETWRLALDAAENETDVWQTGLRLMRFVHGHLTYQSESTHVHTHMQEVLAQRRGVCQDFAHVLLGLARCLHIPALYVSGYLATETASATHAWVEIFVPGLGWQGLDPTHNRKADENYIKLAVGRDYADVPPLRGHYKGHTERTMAVSVQIERRDFS